jgi:molybdate transport system substrate-binding protein
MQLVGLMLLLSCSVGRAPWPDRPRVAGPTLIAVRVRCVIVILASAVLVPACGEDDAGGDSLTVFAAASLTDVFTGLGDDLMAANPDLGIRFNFAGSSALATQIVQGAPADVFASANQAQMAVVTDADLGAGEPAVFTENVLEIAVPAGNPGDVTGLADFADADLALAVCADEVPCGAAAAQVFEAAGITAMPDTEEEDVRAALTKVQLGEVDAALVYASDVRSAGSDVEGIEFPEAEEAVNEYPICALAEAPNPEAAQAFVDLVLSDEGQEALEGAGFRAPSV